MYPAADSPMMRTTMDAIRDRMRTVWEDIHTLEASATLSYGPNIPHRPGIGPGGRDPTSGDMIGPRLIRCPSVIGHTVTTGGSCETGSYGIGVRSRMPDKCN